MIHAQLHPQLFLQTAEPVLEVLDEIGEVQARNPIISTLAEGQRRIDEDFREGVPVVDRIGAPFRAVQQGRNSIDYRILGSSSGTTSVLGSCLEALNVTWVRFSKKRILLNCTPGR